MLPRPEVLPVLRVHADLHRGLREAAAGVPQRVRARARRLRAAHAEVRLPVAREDGLREAAALGGPRPLVYGGERSRAGRFHTKLLGKTILYCFFRSIKQFNLYLLGYDVLYSRFCLDNVSG